MRLLLAPALALASFAQLPAPEVFSPLGKSYTSNPDETQGIQKADLALAKGPATADLLLAAGAARDAVLRFSESIPLYGRGMDDYPNDVRFPRYRGHRFISTRRFDPAIVDLKKATDMAPASFDASYHLALAFYLRGDYSHAAREYQRCLAMSTQPKPASFKGLPANWRNCYSLDDDARVAITVWAWSALRRSGKAADAAALLGTIHENMQIRENRSYFRTLLLYRGQRTETQTMAAADSVATTGYAIGLWHWLDGRKEQACVYWERVLTDPNWAAFGFIAAEGELARGACKPAKKR
jgi:tetratricopeptide (TPR) repeat protein